MLIYIAGILAGKHSFFPGITVCNIKGNAGITDARNIASGIYSGVTTPTEAAAIAALYALVISAASIVR